MNTSKNVGFPQAESPAGSPAPACSALQDLWGGRGMDDKGRIKVTTPVFKNKETAKYYKKLIREAKLLSDQELHQLVLHESDVHPKDQGEFSREFQSHPDEALIESHRAEFEKEGSVSRPFQE